eukprot:141238-Amphidinium_carterae.2
MERSKECWAAKALDCNCVLRRLPFSGRVDVDPFKFWAQATGLAKTFGHSPFAPFCVVGMLLKEPVNGGLD